MELERQSSTNSWRKTSLPKVKTQRYHAKPKTIFNITLICFFYLY